MGTEEDRDSEGNLVTERASDKEREAERGEPQMQPLCPRTPVPPVPPHQAQGMEPWGCLLGSESHHASNSTSSLWFSFSEKRNHSPSN